MLNASVFHGSSNTSLPFFLTLFGWSCRDDCGYHCMHEVTADDLLHSRPVRQFYGKVEKFTTVHMSCVQICTLLFPFFTQVAIRAVVRGSGTSLCALLLIQCCFSCCWLLPFLCPLSSRLSSSWPNSCADGG